MEILGYLASILIGVSLGLIGSGGSILTVPVLVYLMHINPLLATTSSLFIVGTTSLVGGLRAYSKISKPSLSLGYHPFFPFSSPAIIFYLPCPINSLPLAILLSPPIYF